jgi:hypothetical protein
LRGGIGGAPRPFTAGTNDTVVCPAHGLAIDDRVVFWQYEGLGLPGGIVEGTAYWVKAAPDADSFTASSKGPLTGSRRRLMPTHSRSARPRGAQRST